MNIIPENSPYRSLSKVEKYEMIKDENITSKL